MTCFLQDFESYLILNKRASANTVSSYLRDTSKFVDFLNSNNYNTIETIDEKAINDYISQVRKEGKSVSTINRIIASLKAFYGFLVMAGKITNNPTVTLKGIKEKKALPRTLTNKEVDLFLSQPKCDSLKGYRDKAMLELLYATGIRVSELISLNINDINTALGFVRCKKGSAERVIPMYPAAISAIDNYIRTARPLLINSPTEEALFVNLNGIRITRQGFWKIIKRYQEASGIKTEITPHVLRHSFAAHLLENGADISVIKEILGHSDISSTLVYAQLIKNNLKNTYIKFHPRA